MTFEERFGEYLRNLRESRGWTRIQASMRINQICKKHETIVSETSLDKWERGKRVPKIEAVKAMSIVYNDPKLILLRVEVELSKTKAACVGAQTALRNKTNSITKIIAR